MSIGGARVFELDMQKFGQLTREKATMVVKKIAFELDSSIVKGTPVDTGRARGNWALSFGTPSKEVDVNKFDPSAAGKLTELGSEIGKMKLGQVFWMSNNLPYIVPLETGHSKQAPNGMVGVNFARIVMKYGGRSV